MRLKKEIFKWLTCDSVGKSHSSLARAVCIGVHPGKMILFPFFAWFEKQYLGKYKFARTIFAIDMILLGVLLVLSITAMYLWLFPPHAFEDDIMFQAQIAPSEIVTGAPSTLVIRYTNGTVEELKDVSLHFTMPEHFLLQGISEIGKNFEETKNEIRLDNIAVGESAAVHITGVMFGDVNGEQTFTSRMRFTHGGQKNIRGVKTSSKTFSPVKSTLELSMFLPKLIIAGQKIAGKIVYQNKGEYDFPTISIEPSWPDGFVFTSADARMARSTFELPAIKAGESGQMNFTGTTGNQEGELVFTMRPSFTFGKTRYKQTPLTHTASAVASPIALEHSVPKYALKPGAKSFFDVSYKNIADFPVRMLEIGIESSSPFLQNALTVNALSQGELETIEPGEQGQTQIALTLRPSIEQSETGTYEGLVFDSQPFASYSIDDSASERLITRGARIETPLTTSVELDASARYTTQSGDQIGRGPHPPKVGSETTYWIFWRVDGTFNTIKNVVIEGRLARGARMTGRQTVSQGSPVSWDDLTRETRWESNVVNPTFSPTSKIIGVAFEVGITPEIDTEQYELMDDITLTAVDEVTGALLTAGAESVKINLN